MYRDKFGQHYSSSYSTYIQKHKLTSMQSMLQCTDLLPRPCQDSQSPHGFLVSQTIKQRIQKILHVHVYLSYNSPLSSLPPRRTPSSFQTYLLNPSPNTLRSKTHLNLPHPYPAHFKSHDRTMPGQPAAQYSLFSQVNGSNNAKVCIKNCSRFSYPRFLQ